MKLIVGLGNPGTQYSLTRHNAGFLAIDHFRKDLGGISCQSAFQAQICELHFGSTKVFFVKPQTFMNLSGQAVKEICDFYKVDAARDVLIIHDDVDLPLGEIRTTSSASAAGHNGVQNIIDSLGSQAFHRLRLGIETRTDKKNLPTEAFVLQRFSDEEQQQLQERIFPLVDHEIKKFIEAK